ncbi:MAG: ABC-type nitrate/sulfonate/bicarbonate transport system, permease component [Mycobacterium sp.]|nr:ABC-type nitrate/sulfonate/bicarbonate transport system, permease component [Mycobacterium sp.]
MTQTLVSALPAARHPAPPPMAGVPTAPASVGRRRITLPRRGARWISPLAVLALWQVASSTGVLPPSKLAGPGAIVSTAWDLVTTGQLPDALLVSLGRVAVGVLAGVGVGVLLGLLAGLSRAGEALVDPVVQMLRTLPFLGLVPLFILWFGIGETPKITLIALGVAFPVYLNLAGGIRGVDPKLLEAAAVAGLSTHERITNVVLPGALPSLLVGLRQALGVAWLSLIVAEQLNATSGLGYLINNARDFLRTDVIVVGLVVYAILGLATDALVRLAERRALRWRGAVVAR